MTILHRGPADPGRLLSVTGPEALTMHDVAAIVGDRTGVAMRYEPVTPEAGRRRLARSLGPMGAFLADHYAAVAVETAASPLSPTPSRDS